MLNLLILVTLLLTPLTAYATTARVSPSEDACFANTEVEMLQLLVKVSFGIPCRDTSNLNVMETSIKVVTRLNKSVGGVLLPDSLRTALGISEGDIVLLEGYGALRVNGFVKGDIAVLDSLTFESPSLKMKTLFFIRKDTKDAV